jgi:hypothetical protein
VEAGNPRYILDLLLSIINVSVQTVDIVNGLPKIDFEAETTDGEEVKLYPTRDGDENLNMVAEPETKPQKNKMHKKTLLPSKVCTVCQRPFNWRKKWEKNWDEVRYCSEKCKRNKKQSV